MKAFYIYFIVKRLVYKIVDNPTKLGQMQKFIVVVKYALLNMLFQKKSMPLQWGIFLVCSPPSHPRCFDSYIPLKILVFDTTPPLLGIFTNPLCVGYGYFQKPQQMNPTNKEKMLQYCHIKMVYPTLAQIHNATFKSFKCFLMNLQYYNLTCVILDRFVLCCTFSLYTSK